MCPLCPLKKVCGMVYGFTKSQLSKGGNYERGKQEGCSSGNRNNGYH